MRRQAFLTIALALVFAAAVCGQTPTINSINPSTKVAGSATFLLTVTGTNFVPPPLNTAGPGSRVRWGGGTFLPTTYISATQLQANVDASLVANPGTATVDVLNPNLPASNSTVFTILAPLVITTSSPLPSATLGSFYSVTLAASGGTPTYGNWRVRDSVLPSGLTLNAATGVLSGTPTAVSGGTVNVFVDDSGGQTSSKSFSLTVVNVLSLTITTTSVPNGTLGAAYSQQFTATGGFLPYTWLFTGGSLPPDLTLSTAGVLSGTPTQAGSFTFMVTVNGTVSRQFTLFVAIPPAPVPSITDVPAIPGQQPSFNVQLSGAYVLDISGTVTLTFTPESALPDDPMIVFPNGRRTLDFTITAGSTVSSGSLQTGTVAGRIDLTITRLVAAGQSILPFPAPVRSVQIPRSAPKINSVQVVKTSGGFNVLVTGYSTPRQMTQAAFNFTVAAGKSLQTTQVTVPVDGAFTTWYGGAASAQYGSTFLYTQPFTVQGDLSAIASVSVTLTNAVGTSSPMSATF